MVLISRHTWTNMLHKAFPSRKTSTYSYYLKSFIANHQSHHKCINIERILIIMERLVLISRHTWTNMLHRAFPSRKTSTYSYYLKSFIANHQSHHKCINRKSNIGIILLPLVPSRKTSTYSKKLKKHFYCINNHIICFQPNHSYCIPFS